MEFIRIAHRTLELLSKDSDMNYRAVHGDGLTRSLMTRADVVVIELPRCDGRQRRCAVPGGVLPMYHGSLTTRRLGEAAVASLTRVPCRERKIEFGFVQVDDESSI